MICYIQSGCWIACCLTGFLYYRNQLRFVTAFSSHLSSTYSTYWHSRSPHSTKQNCKISLQNPKINILFWWKLAVGGHYTCNAARRLQVEIVTQLFKTNQIVVVASPTQINLSSSSPCSLPAVCLQWVTGHSWWLILHQLQSEANKPSAFMAWIQPLV